MNDLYLNILLPQDSSPSLLYTVGFLARHTTALRARYSYHDDPTISLKVGEATLTLDSFFFHGGQPRSLTRENLPGEPAWLEFEGERTPILYGEPRIERIGRYHLRCHADLLGSIFFCLSRWEESLLALDAYGRPPDESLWAVRHHLHHIPIADRCAQLARHLLAYAAMRDIPPPEDSYSVWWTHDIDFLGRHRLPGLLHALAGDLLHRHSASALLHTLKASLDPNVKDPFDTFEWMLSLGNQHKWPHALFFRPTHLSLLHNTYSIATKRLKRLLRTLREANAEIGIHPSPKASTNASLLASEWQRLVDANDGHPIKGGRQHYLAYTPNVTLQLWLAQGAAYDAGMGYHAHIGFRAGTAHPYPFFDLTTNQATGLEIRPLHIMDVALKLESKRTNTSPLALACTIQREARLSNGTLALLLHNDFPARNGINAGQLALGCPLPAPLEWLSIGL